MNVSNLQEYLDKHYLDQTIETHILETTEDEILISPKTSTNMCEEMVRLSYQEGLEGTMMWKYVRVFRPKSSLRSGHFGDLDLMYKFRELQIQDIETLYMYIGEFKEGRKEGRGTISFGNQVVYEGEFLCNLPHGHGKTTFENEDQ